MANVKKFTNGAVVHQLKHCNRQSITYSNTDIDPDRRHLNYNLTPDHGGLSDYAYYQQRKSELYCYGRDDVKTMAAWIVTAPEGVETREEQEAFFRGVCDFLCARYGEENVINVSVHYDEGKAEEKKSRWGGVEKDADGNVKKYIAAGRPHLHFNFVPVVKDAKHKQGWKICANSILNRKELRAFHPDLQAWLRERNVPGAEGVINGKTKEQGRNMTVEELKERYEMKREIERLREIERRYNMERTVDMGAQWR